MSGSSDEPSAARRDALDAELLLRAVALKHLDRAGWLRAGIARPESVAAHSYGVAFAALLRAGPEHDLGKLLGMALLHDLAEVVVGDITPHDGISRDEKRARERAAFDELLAHRPELRALVDELELGESPEARLVHALDKADMDVTAVAYAGLGHDTRDFRESARAAVVEVFPALRALSGETPRF